MAPLKTAIVVALAILVVAAVAVPVTSGASGEAAAVAAKKGKKKKKAKPKRVKVGDDYYSPTSVKVRRGGRVRWKWLPDNLNPHNVTLTRPFPRGVKKKDYRSATGSIGVKFVRKFKKAGRYGFYCTLHPFTMDMTVQVKKGKKKKR